MTIYDVIVIGGGVTGCSASMYAARFNLKVLQFATQPGGLITTTNFVENYPGIKSITGPDMGQLFVEQAMEAGVQFDFSTVTAIRQTEIDQKPAFEITTQTQTFQAKTVILATGTQHKHLGAPGEKEYSAKGVTYCALCDAAFFKDKTVAVVGGGDSAAIDANILTQHASKVFVLVRKDQMRAEPINLKRLENNPKVEIKYLTEIQEIQGDNQKVTHLLLKDGSTLPIDGLFVAIGWNPVSALAKDLGATVNDRQEVVVNRESQTNIAGFFAAGDVTDAKFKQAIIGAAEGVYASVGAYNHIQQYWNTHG